MTFTVLTRYASPKIILPIGGINPVVCPIAKAQNETTR
jgi:hypothetical protein